VERLIAHKVAALSESATETVDNLYKGMKQSGIKDMISLGAGEPSFDTPCNIKQAACAALREGKTKYEPTAGDYRLREAICTKLREENGIDAGIEDVIVTVGAKFAVFLAFQTLLSPGDRVLLLDPAWVTYEPAAQLSGATVVRIASCVTTGFQPELTKIRGAMESSIKLVVLNSPCNPTGAVFTVGTIRSICEMAEEYGALVLSDEIYEHLIYEGKHYSPASEFDNVITVNGFSKSHAMTGWRLGYITAAPEVVQGMLKITQHSTSCVTSFAQAGAIEALVSETSREAAKAMLDEYSDRRRLMIKLIEESDYLDLGAVPTGAFYCFPSYSCAKPSALLAQELLQAVHVATVPGAAFGDCGEGHLRLSYTAAEEEIVDAMRRMEHYLSGEGLRMADESTSTGFSRTRTAGK